MAYTSVDYTLNHLVCLLSTPGLTFSEKSQIPPLKRLFGFLVAGRQDTRGVTINPKIQTLKLELGLLRAFLRWMAKGYLEDGNLEGLLPQIQVAVHNAGRYLESIRSSEGVEEIEKELDQLAHKVLKTIQPLKPKIANVYINNITKLLPSRLTATMMDIMEVEEFLNSLINNLSDLLTYRNPSTFPLWEELLILEGMLRFLRNVLRFATVRCADLEKLKDFSTHAKSVAVETAYISFMCSFEPINEIIKDKVAELAEKIVPYRPEIRGIYAGVVKALKPLTTETRISNLELSNFIDALHLILLLNQGRSSVASFDILRHELAFLSSYVKDPPMHSFDSGKWKNPVDDAVDDLQRELRSWNTFDSHAQPPKHYTDLLKLKEQLTIIEALAIKVGGVIFSCFYVNEMDDQKPTNTEIALVDDFVEKIKRIKAEIKFSMSKVPLVNVSRTQDLGFIKTLSKNLNELLDSLAGPTISLVHEVAEILDDIEFLTSFLENCGDSSHKCEKRKKLATDIIHVAHIAEYVTDSCFVRDGPLWYHSVCFADVIQEMKIIRTKVERFNSEMTYESDPRGTAKASKPRDADNELVPLFQEEMIKLKDELISGDDGCKVIPIVGMAGLGKTTLARRLYDDHSIISHFDLRTFTCVSQVYGEGQVILKILHNITESYNCTVNENNFNEAQDLLYEILEEKKFLIVLDDLWNVATWYALSSYIPENKTGSRILITTRSTEVAAVASSGHHILHLRFLEHHESWQLLEKKIFQQNSCPPELVDVANQIVDQCQGLPIAVVLTAGILASTEENFGSWKQVLQSSQMRKNEVLVSILDLSYQNLPDCLRQCFIYFGAYPMNEEIAVSKLIRLWTAEGFIKHSEEEEEKLAMGYLEFLTERNLVMVCRRTSAGLIKSCKIHNSVHAFCMDKAKHENAFQLVERYTGSSIPNAAICEHRRLCISSHGNDYISSSISGPLVRSLVLTGRSSNFPRYACDLSFLFQNFKLLRVLDLGCINVGNAFPVGLEKIVLLKYLEVKGEMTSIPSSVVNLQQLESFVIIGLSGEVSVPDSIWSLTKLRHLHINDRASFGAPDYSQQMSKVPYLRSMSNPLLIYGEDSQNILMKLPSLKKLKCIFLESWDSHMKKNMFPTLDLLPKLRALKLFYHGRKREACKFSFPSTLKRLTLSRFCLPWDQISVIGKLPKLEVLKLLNKSFEGSLWEMKNGEFPCLRFLRLDTLNLERWHVSKNSLPNLERLELHNCKQLYQIPADLTNNLKEIEVKWCGQSVACSAREIQEAPGRSWRSKIEVIIYEEPGDLTEN